MIEEFSFGNTGSFKDIQTLNMTAAKIKSANPKLDSDNLIQVNENLSLLKSKAIYGANASGKSNVIKALRVFRDIIKDSIKEPDALIIIDSFKLSTESENEPSYFQIIIRIDDVRYRYGFEADSKSIRSEWLFYTPNTREQVLFKRERNEVVEINKKHFQEGHTYMGLVGSGGEDMSIAKSALFLTTLASFGFGKVSKLIFKKLSELAIITNDDNKRLYNFSSENLADEKYQRMILGFLKHADTGIEKIFSYKMPEKEISNSPDPEYFKEKENNRFVFVEKSKFNENKKVIGKSLLSFNLQESLGTQKVFGLSPLIAFSFSLNQPIIIDELDSSLHPVLTKKIVELYNSPANKGAQLIFTTHDTNLLSSDLLRRDQIDFVEKDKYGASHLYSLVEIKGVRKDASFEKDYIQGKYGAIPFVGDFSTLIDKE